MQVPLMLGDYFRDNPKVSAIVDAAIEVVKWFNNHSFCLAHLNKEQMTTYQKNWALILPVITRWTSNFCALARLLQVNKAIKVTATRNREEFIDYVGSDASKVAKAERVLDRMVNDNWWKELAMYVAERLSTLTWKLTDVTCLPE
jgi:hypothetical protein